MIYKELRVWQKADEFALEVYKVTSAFPKNEMYAMVSQLRRAAVSVPTNIVEGYARKGDKELSRFLNIPIGSLAESEYLLDFSHRLGYISKEDFDKVETLRAEVGKMLWTFYSRVSHRE